MAPATAPSLPLGAPRAVPPVQRGDGARGRQALEVREGWMHMWLVTGGTLSAAVRSKARSRLAEARPDVLLALAQMWKVGGRGQVDSRS